MVNLDLRMHPNVLFCYNSNYVELIIRVENRGKHHVWAEADIKTPEKISLSPDNNLRKGRVRIGIVDSKQFLEKSVRIYAGKYTNPQMYRCGVTLYTYNKDGIIESRLEKAINVRCELKKEATI